MKRLFILFLFINGYINAQNFQKQNLDSKHINDLCVQNNGLIWVATDEGLSVFYDDEFELFYSNIEDSLSLLNSDVKKLFNSNSEKLIALSQDGISAFNEQNNTFNRIRTSSEPVFIYENTFSNSFWVATKNSGYFHLDNTFSLITNYSFDPLNPLSISTSNLSNQSKNSITAIDDQFTYISTSNGFNVFNNKLGTFKRYFKGKRTSLTSNYIHGLYSVEKDILIVTPNEIVLYNPKEKTFTLLYRSESEILGFNELDENRLLIKTKKKNFIASLNEKKLEFEPIKLNDQKLRQNNLYTGRGFIFWEKGGLDLQLANNTISDIENINISAPVNSVKKVKNN